MEKYVINDEYDFELVADGPRPSGVGSTSITVKLTHEDVLEMAEFFIEEEPYAMYERDFGLKDELDEIAAEDFAMELFEEWKEEYESEHDDDDDDEFDDEDYDDDDGEKTVEDFYDAAWERLCECYFCWDQRLIDDCIDYYNEHKE